MREATDKDGYLGAVVLIAHQGRIVDFRAYGQRDLARSEPMRKDAIFRIYSMSKTLASAALMTLVEQGRIGLDDPVARYLPELDKREVVIGGSPDAPRLRPARGPITVRELLTHTAGFPAGVQGDDTALALMQQQDPHAASDLRGFVERLSRAPLAADPGTRFGYDGAAIETLARVIEVVSAQPFDAYLRERILRPLGMRDTGFSVPAADRARVVDITTMGDDGRLRIADGPSAREPGAALNAYPSGAGGLYSTACDYARFAQMLLDGGRIGTGLDAQCDPRDDHATADTARAREPRVLRADTVAMMLGNQLSMLDPPVHQFDPGEGFGFGGAVIIDPAKRGQPGSIGRFGWPGAASTTYAIDPRRQWIAIALLQHLPRQDVAHDLPRISRDVYRLVEDSMKPFPETSNADTEQ